MSAFYPLRTPAEHYRRVMEILGIIAIAAIAGLLGVIRLAQLKRDLGEDDWP